LRILSPTSCKTVEEQNGIYELTLEHPVDEDGAWKSLLEFNIIKATGQLFRIYKKSTKLSSKGTATRTVYAKHIWYDLADRLIESCDIAGLSGMSALNTIFASMHYFPDQTNLLEYAFSYYSNITDTSIDCAYEMTSPVGCMIGEDNSFVNRLGGTLHRDNFYFSICEPREGSNSNAFNIVHGLNMLEIEEVVDTSSLITYLHTEDNYGRGNDISYSNSAVFFPHIISKGKVFNYSQYEEGALGIDMSDYWKQYSQIQVSYTVKFANLHNTELYKDFINLKNYNVGDSGTIYSEELGISTYQTIIRKEYDVLNDEVTSITLGNFQGSVARRERFENTITRADNIIKRVCSPAFGRNVNSEEELKYLARNNQLQPNCTYYDISGEEDV
jgi:phage minor structural protein